MRVKNRDIIGLPRGLHEPTAIERALEDHRRMEDALRRARAMEEAARVFRLIDRALPLQEIEGIGRFSR